MSSSTRLAVLGLFAAMGIGAAVCVVLATDLPLAGAAGNQFGAFFLAFLNHGLHALVLAAIGDGAHHGGVICGVADHDLVADLCCNAFGLGQLIRRHQHP